MRGQNAEDLSLFLWMPKGSNEYKKKSKMKHLFLSFLCSKLLQD